MTLEQDILQARILIVDDQAANVTLMTRLLQDAGYVHVTSTQHPQEVAQRHQVEPFDLILLDLQMPVMDGFEVMAALQNASPDKFLPVIVLTAQPAHKLRALQCGARDFISKPFDLLEVSTRIRNMLEVGVLYKRLADHNRLLEQAVQERTAELQASEARYRSLTSLASDWYWEQDADGHFTQVSGPVMDMLGLRDEGSAAALDAAATEGWNLDERAQLQQHIALRRPFLDFPFSRVDAAGVRHEYRVSGEPMFDLRCRFVGYRGIGIEVPLRAPATPIAGPT